VTSESANAGTFETVDGWVTRIRSEMLSTIGSIIKVGHTLVECKESVDHGQFGLVLGEVNLKPRAAQMFMAVARHPVLINADNVTYLPSGDYRSLYELSRLEPPELDAAIAEGRVRSDMTRADVRAVVARRAQRGLSGTTRPKLLPASLNPL